MRLALLVVLPVLASCASSGAVPESTTSRPVQATSVGGVRLYGSDGAKESIVTGNVDQVWRVLPSVYDSLGILLTDVDAASHTLGNSGMKAYKKLGSSQMSKYIDCGSTQGFPSADTYQLTMAIRSQAYVNDKGATAVSTLMEVTGRPMAFAGEVVRCSTKGTLEKEIGDRVKKMLAP